MKIKNIISRKGQSLSINTIVIAAIALIILVVLIAIFGGQIRKFLFGASSCSGECTERVECDIGYNTVLSGTNCDDKNTEGMDRQYEYVCCIPLIDRIT
ncbi:hypothetical protein HN789_04560 [archaeon]|nr:hypothetical protein [archaeon]MBT4022458.1 hypothetical protein [archaeon]MBT4272613.1 hypothetical protein [archaeon]MBT4461221.1 hypothetical protein [archaeon]MBT4858265.1 hypothetical protein [archaeon]